MSTTEREWIVGAASEHAAGAVEHATRLCSIPSPTGDHDGARRMAAAIAELLPAGVALAAEDSSTPSHPPDLRATLRGAGRGSILLLGHLDTVVGLDAHRAPVLEGDRLNAPGAYDMKGGLVVACAVLRALASRPDLFGRLELLVVADEEWRTVPLRHAKSAPGRYDACLCFEGGEDGNGTAALIAKRKGAASLRIEALGVAAHSGAAHTAGRSALAALAALALELQDFGPGASERSVVPTVIRAGEALNSVPDHGELILDVRAFDRRAIEEVLDSVPEERDGVELRPALESRFPGMDSRTALEGVLPRIRELAGRQVVTLARGGSSDAAFFSSFVPFTVDGLGPLGGGDHSPAEHILISSIAPQTELALAVALAALQPPDGVRELTSRPLDTLER